MSETPSKLMVAITTAVALYLDEERRAADQRPPRPILNAAAWTDFGRGELMRQRTVWQLRMAR